jgi:DNA recombination protein RmuC
VLLFIPIEASFSVAVQEDQELFSYAWDQKIVIVSPSTLLATLRTISSIWQQENQTRNAMEIARQGGALYDKFVGFISDMEKIGKNLTLTQASYGEAMNKLHSGSGNLVKRAESIKKLGAKTTKELPLNLID